MIDDTGYCTETALTMRRDVVGIKNANDENGTLTRTIDANV